MKKIRKTRIFATAAVLVCALVTVQCGFILHPEREGQAKGKIDVPILLMDCAWLLVGVVPGVIALVVDFYTGCIYEPGGPAAVDTIPGARVAFRIRGSAPAEAAVSVTIGQDGQQVALLFDQKFEKGESLDEIVLTIPEDLGPGEYELNLAVNGDVSAHWELNIN